LSLSNRRRPIAILKAPQSSSSTVLPMAAAATSSLLPLPLPLPFPSPSLQWPSPSSPSSLTYIDVVPLSTSNRHPRIAAIVFIDIFAINGGGIIGVAVSVAIAIAIPFAVSAIAIVAIIVDAIVIVQSPSSNRRPRIASVLVIDII
jgi:hypothetical protein